MTLTNTTANIKTLRETIKADLLAVRAARVRVKELVAQAKAEKEAARAAKRAAKDIRTALKNQKATERAAKKALRIKALEERLANLKRPVGLAAKKAARKPGPVTVTKA